MVRAGSQLPPIPGFGYPRRAGKAAASAENSFVSLATSTGNPRHEPLSGRGIGGTLRRRVRSAGRWVLFMIVPVALWPQPAKTAAIITRVDQIRSLTPEEAAKGHPVRIRGVVTMDAPAPDFFVQDSTAGIYVEGSSVVNYPHVLGQLVEVEGITGPGKFAPVIRERS